MAAGRGSYLLHQLIEKSILKGEESKGDVGKTVTRAEKMDLRAMQDDEVVVVTENSAPQSAWPPWKHLLEDLAEARPPPR